ncbi:thioredoxin-like [Dreissena polymorpha]|uniref:thioredoxin-like n=1 Tax=Dreissena polymorpha TaxID=45954 RepID=UPI002264B645|nr:thioredoxin-like [Dreissena polymorpha]
MHDVYNMDELQSVMEDCKGKVVVIDFWAGWCGPCKLIGPMFQRLSKESALTSSLEFVRVDVDEAPDIAEWVGIECMPLIAFYKNGKKIDELAGANAKVLEEKIREHANH